MAGTVRARVGLELRPWAGRGDRALARRAAAGEDAAFAAIFERYGQDLYRYCLSILRNPDDAQDALQNTMAGALRSLPGEAREIELRPWLFRVAHNNAISLVRARRETVDPQAIAELPGTDGEERLQDRERLRGLLGDLEMLSEQSRAALTLRELSGLSFDEVAAALSITPGAARQAVYEARQALRELEEGREMDCDGVCRLISDGDRRALRAKRVRAHLRACPSCEGFRDSISARKRELAALFPPLPAAAAAGLLHAVLGAGGGASAGAGTTAALGGGAAAAGKGLASSLAAKSVASVVAATAIGVGAADYGGLIDAPLLGEGGPPSAERSADSPPSPSGSPAQSGEAGLAVAPSRGGNAPAAGRETPNGGNRGGRDAGRSENAAADGPKGGPAAAPGPAAHSNAGGAANATPAATAQGGAPGASAPAHSQAGGAPVAHSSAGGTPSSPAPDRGASGAPAGPPASASVGPPAAANAGGSQTAIDHGGGRPSDPGAGAPVD